LWWLMSSRFLIG